MPQGKALTSLCSPDQLIREKQELLGSTVWSLEVTLGPMEKGWFLQPDILTDLNQSSWVGQLVRQGKGTRPKRTGAGAGQKALFCSPYPRGPPILGAQEWVPQPGPNYENFGKATSAPRPT